MPAWHLRAPGTRPTDDRVAAIRRFFERGQPLIAAGVRAAAIDRANSAEYVVFLINLADAELRQYIERCGHRVPRAHQAAAQCVPIAAARAVLRGLGMEANLNVSFGPGWLRVCVLGGWEAYAFVHVAIDPSAPEVGRA